MISDAGCCDRSLSLARRRYSSMWLTCSFTQQLASCSHRQGPVSLRCIHTGCLGCSFCSRLRSGMEFSSTDSCRILYFGSSEDYDLTRSNLVRLISKAVAVLLLIPLDAGETHSISVAFERSSPSPYDKFHLINRGMAGRIVRKPLAFR